VVGLIAIGALTANLVGKSLLRVGERILARVPLIRSIYSAVKQVFETFASNEGSSFKEAVLVEYPGKGLWVIGFVTSRTPDPAIAGRVRKSYSLSLPSSPNPAMGQWVYVRPERLKNLDMPMDKAAKLVISFGILSNEPPAGDLGERAPGQIGK